MGLGRDSSALPPPSHSFHCHPPHTPSTVTTWRQPWSLYLGGSGSGVPAEPSSPRNAADQGTINLQQRDQTL